MSENTSLNIYQKLSQIRRSVAAIQKNKSGYGYKYVTEDEILAKVTAGMNKHNVSLVPGIVPNTMKVSPYSYKKVKGAKGGNTPIEETVNEILIDAEMTWTWVNDDNPDEVVIVPWMLVGQQSDAAQAFGSGLTYTTRYFLLKYFQVATTEDDPDNYRTKQKNAADADMNLLLATMIEEIGNVVQPILSENNADKTAALKKLMQSKITKNGKPSTDYRIIKDATLASEVLNLVRDFAEKNGGM